MVVKLMTPMRQVIIHREKAKVHVTAEARLWEQLAGDFWIASFMD